MNSQTMDRIFALVVFSLAALLFIVSLSYDAASSFFPRALCLLLMALSAVQLASKSGLEYDKPSLRTCASAAFIAGAVLCWLGLVYMVNIELATLVFTFASLRLLGMRHYVWNWNIAAGLMLLVHVLFFRVLDVARPESWWL